MEIKVGDGEVFIDGERYVKVFGWWKTGVVLRA